MPTVQQNLAQNTADEKAHCPTEVLHFSQSNHFQECSFMPSNCLWAIPLTSNKSDLAGELAQDKGRWNEASRSDLPAVSWKVLNKAILLLTEPRGKHELEEEQTEALSLLPAVTTHTCSTATVVLCKHLLTCFKGSGHVDDLMFTVAYYMHTTSRLLTQLLLSLLNVTCQQLFRMTIVDKLWACHLSCYNLCYFQSNVILWNNWIRIFGSLN